MQFETFLWKKFEKKKKQVTTPKTKKNSKALWKQFSKKFAWGPKNCLFGWKTNMLMEYNQRITIDMKPIIKEWTKRGDAKT